MTSRHIAVTSGAALFKASIFAARSDVCNPRGLMHNDATTISEISNRSRDRRRGGPSRSWAPSQAAASEAELQLWLWRL